MNRYALLWIVFVVVFLLMAGGGFVVGKWWIESNAVTGGWCCMGPGAECALKRDSAQCGADGGLIFDIMLRTCNNICKSLAPSKS